LHLTEVKGPVVDALKNTGLLAQLAYRHVFMSTHQAMRGIHDRRHH
jgi:hypothetical protein